MHVSATVFGHLQGVTLSRDYTAISHVQGKVSNGNRTYAYSVI